MKELLVFIEINGEQIYVGSIQGNHPDSARFSYAAEYRNHQDSRPISLSLPFSEEIFTPEQTRNFFEGLLPEGFTRKCVAEWMHVDEKDYLSILAGLGIECIGAVKIIDQNAKEVEPVYQNLSIEEVQALAKDGAAGQWYLPIGDAPSTHIVKQSHVRLKGIVMNEQLCMMTARNLGINIPDSFIVNRGFGTGYGNIVI
ncbi:MAG: HipA N-terminal domain-containing protein [Ruminococcus sp.]|nr:HipA N-terminal domain-containing protein [Ruminococcus sp.]